jgi:hypothetical protein
MSRWFPLTLIVVTVSHVRAADADVTAEKGEDRIVFKVGGETAAVYQFAGTVPHERGGEPKPLAKPFFYPLHAPGGIPVTRGWPVVLGTPGETTDHVHQKSAWFCHGDVIPEGIEMKTRSSDKRVHGVDFWSEGRGHGRIVCTAVEPAKPLSGNGVTIRTRNEWRTPDDVNILDEDRDIEFRTLPNGRLIVLHITLKATVCPITFGDTKEGSLGVRVHDAFRLNGPGSDGVVTSSDGTTAAAPARDNLPMWGKPADWHDYSGSVDGKKVGIAVFDHPKNPHRSLWHTRAYGLMAANPFGRADSGFPAAKGNTELVKLAQGESLKLRYGIYVHTGDAQAGQVAAAFREFIGAKP